MYGGVKESEPKSESLLLPPTVTTRFGGETGIHSNSLGRLQLKGR